LEQNVNSEGNKSLIKSAVPATAVGSKRALYGAPSMPAMSPIDLPACDPLPENEEDTCHQYNSYHTACQIVMSSCFRFSCLNSMASFHAIISCIFHVSNIMYQ
jgi:hypothetical protein